VTPVAAGELVDDAVALLQRLIRLNTVSPPGNETPAAELLRDFLTAAGVDCGLYAKESSRANLVARLPGRGEGPSLLFLGHTDTVLADAARWSVDPWSGDVRAGEVWGRGALDMKGQVAAEATVVAALARSGFTPAGDVVFAAVADEEVGEGHGIEWLCEAHPELVRTDYSINEGGGVRVLDGRAYYSCATGEKRQTPFKLTVLGRSGHGSRPALADNALVRAARVIERISELTATPSIPPELARALATMVPGVPAEAALERLHAIAPDLAEGYDALLGFTVAPTVLHGSTRVNVIPGRVEILSDCRLLPGQTEAEMEAIVRAHLSPLEFELEWSGGRGGSRSPVDTPLFAAIEEFVSRDEPGAELVPALGGGFTDSHYVREAFGTVAYGFLPLRALDPGLHLAHGEDERVPVADVELWLRLLLHLAAADLG
jgi:acetylornithine deacetylase/succinyl-diaminopimelate desuccinylase-like protein